ncbi:hypothetical protein [Streptomyces fructofermentans]|uniref:hypothetical protein n=1 Tax=Streptomyces fructofermentans TaxID=152141 RepID=UPI001E36A3F7|nr:hypothetical protein [Streptomyces fructofermentans]
MEAIRPVRRTLLRDRAYEAIRDTIVSGGIEPGRPAADGDPHDVLVRVSGNRAAATIARCTPLVRRLERRRFGGGGNCRSAGLHGRLIEACADGDVAGMVDLVGRGEIGRDSTVLHAHLGGQPALNAYSALF